jgi:2-isopropylmalate synthase
MRAESDADGPWTLESLAVDTDSGAAASVTLQLKHSGGRIVEQKMTAEGPVDAVVKAIDAATGISVQVRKFEVHSVSVGEDAQGEALLTVEHNGRSYRGSGISTNIIEAAASAYLEVINRIESTRATAERTGVERRAVDSSVISAI